jgi:hypothetical protein
VKLVKKSDEYTIYLRRDGRHAVTGADKAPINGEEKVRILVDEGLIKAAMPAEPAPAEDEPAALEAEDGAAEDGAEQSGSDDAGEE